MQHHYREYSDLIDWKQKSSWRRAIKQQNSERFVEDSERFEGWEEGFSFELIFGRKTAETAGFCALWSNPPTIVVGFWLRRPKFEGDHIFVAKCPFECELYAQHRLLGPKPGKTKYSCLKKGDLRLKNRPYDPCSLMCAIRLHSSLRRGLAFAVLWTFVL